MNLTPNPHGAGDRSENAAVRHTQVVVDCSAWESDIPADQWSSGRSVNAATRVEKAAPVDCSGWDREPAVWLELTVSFDAATDPAAVAAVTAKLVDALDRMAPELGLVYDVGRSRVADGGDVVVALAPRNPADAEARLSQLIGRVRTALQHDPVPVTIARAGLCYTG